MHPADKLKVSIYDQILINFPQRNVVT